MTVRTLVIGAGGLLGSAVLAEARGRHGEAAHGTFRQHPPGIDTGAELHRLDLRDDEATAELLRRLRPETVINCAGIVKAVCSDPIEAIALNAALPHRLAFLLGEWDGRLVQVSTDCVFSGTRGRYYEEDLPDPPDLYGRTKLLGEVTAAPHLTVRTSFIGFESETRRGLLAWFLGQQGSLEGFRRAVWSGLTADLLARILVDLATRREVTGLLHLTGEAIDKHRLLHRLAEVFDRGDLTIEPVDEPRIDRSLGSHRMEDLGISVPPIGEMLEGLRRWGEEHGFRTRPEDWRQ